MTRRRLLASCTLLGVIVAVAAGLEGKPIFTGARSLPHLGFGPAAPPTFHPPPAPDATTAPMSGGAASHVPLRAILLWTAVGVAVVLAVLLFLWLRARPRRDRLARSVATPTSPPVAAVAQAAEPEPDVPVIRSGIEEALLDLERDGEPGDAVVRAWLGLQQTAEQSGVARSPSETPTEFTTRILGKVFVGDRNGHEAITTLLRLYLRTRFGDHPVTASDVALVRQALRELVSTWDSLAVPSRRASASPGVPLRRGGD